MPSAECEHDSFGEGRYVNADVRNLKDDWHVDIYLTDRYGCTGKFPYRDYRFRFWVATSHELNKLKEPFIGKDGSYRLGIENIPDKPKMYHGKPVYEFVMSNPHYRSEVRKTLNRLDYQHGFVETIGLNRSINEDFRRAFFPPWRTWLEFKDGKFELVETEMPKLKKMYWDIEVDNIKPDGTNYLPKADNIVTPIISSATHVAGKTEVATFVNCPLPYVHNVGSEAGLISRTWDRAVEDDIDTLIGYNIDGYDFPVFEARSRAIDPDFNKIEFDYTKEKGGMNYIYHVKFLRYNPEKKKTAKRFKQMQFQTIDLYPIIAHMLYPMPAASLKAAIRVFLGKEPLEYGAVTGEMFKDPTRRMMLFKYSAGDVDSLAEIDEKLGLTDAMDELSPVLRQWPEGFRKTSDDLCKQFVYSLYGPDEPIGDVEFATRDWSKIKNEFVIDQHRYGLHPRATRLGTQLIHLFTINSLQEELKRNHRSEIVRAADVFKKLLTHYNEQWSSTRKPMYKTAYQMLKRIVPGLVSTFASQMYEWHDKGLSDEYQKRFRENVMRIGGDKILWAGFDEMFVDDSNVKTVLSNSKSLSHGYLVDMENNVMLSVRDKTRRLYYDPATDQLYPKGFSLARKTWSPIVNRSAIAVGRALLIEGEPAAETFITELGKWIRSGQYSKEDTLHEGLITKPKEHYRKDLPQVVAARFYDAEPYEKLIWGLEFNGDEERIVPAEKYNPKPQDLIEELVKRLEPIMWDEKTVRHLLNGQIQRKVF